MEIILFYFQSLKSTTYGPRPVQQPPRLSGQVPPTHDYDHIQKCPD